MNKILCIVLVLVVLLAGCASITKSKSVADAQVVTFHQQLNDQKYDAIITAAGPEMFGNISKANMVKILTVVHRKLGNVTQSKNVNYNVRVFNTESTVELVQNTKFEKGSGTEKFTFFIKQGKPYLVGYYINSQDLIMK